MLGGYWRSFAALFGTFVPVRGRYLRDCIAIAFPLPPASCRQSGEASFGWYPVAGILWATGTILGLVFAIAC